LLLFEEARWTCPFERVERKKAGVEEYPRVFLHAGLLVNGFPGMAEVPFI